MQFFVVLTSLWLLRRSPLYPFFRSALNLCGNNFAPNTSMVTRQLQSTSVLVTLSACGAHCAAGYICSPYTVSSAMQPCPAGSYCPVDSFATLSSTGLLAGGSVCPAGRFSAVGAVACSDCPAGVLRISPEIHK